MNARSFGEERQVVFVNVLENLPAPTVWQNGVTLKCQIGEHNACFLSTVKHPIWSSQDHIQNRPFLVMLLRSIVPLIWNDSTNVHKKNQQSWPGHIPCSDNQDIHFLRPVYFYHFHLSQNKFNFKVIIASEFITVWNNCVRNIWSEK